MTARQTYDVIALPGGGWAKGNWRETFDGTPRFNTYKTDFQTSLNNSLGGFPLAGRFGLFAQAPQQLTPVQAAAKNFGDLPIVGPLINTIRDYEDRINYRNADPETRRLLGLE
jgi:hypothetical protein